jgi:hypothetical protein
MALAVEGQNGQAEPMLREALHGLSRTPDVDARKTSEGLFTWCGLLLPDNRLPEAEPFLRRLVEALHAEDEVDDPVTRRAELLLALAAEDPGWSDKSEALLREYLSLGPIDIFPDDRHLAALQGFLGERLVEQERYEEAERLLRESHKMTQTAHGAKHAMTVASLRRLVDLYLAWDKPAQAAVWQAKLEEPTTD